MIVLKTNGVISGLPINTDLIETLNNISNSVRGNWFDPYVGGLIGVIGALLFHFIISLVSKSKERKQILKENNLIKETIRLFLFEIICPILTKIKEVEHPEFRNKSYAYEPNMTFGMYPALNSSVIGSLDNVKLLEIFKNDFPKIIEIKSIINNLENRTPFKSYSKLVEYVNTHLDEDYEKYSDLKGFETRKGHFENCKGIKNTFFLANKNTETVDQIISSIFMKIDEVFPK